MTPCYTPSCSPGPTRGVFMGAYQMCISPPQRKNGWKPADQQQGRVQTGTLERAGEKKPYKWHLHSLPWETRLSCGSWLAVYWFYPTRTEVIWPLLTSPSYIHFLHVHQTQGFGLVSVEGRTVNSLVEHTISATMTWLCCCRAKAAMRDNMWTNENANKTLFYKLWFINKPSSEPQSADPSSNTQKQLPLSRLCASCSLCLELTSPRWAWDLFPYSSQASLMSHHPKGLPWSPSKDTHLPYVSVSLFTSLLWEVLHLTTLLMILMILWWFLEKSICVYRQSIFLYITQFVYSGPSLWTQMDLLCRVCFNHVPSNDFPPRFRLASAVLHISCGEMAQSDMKELLCSRFSSMKSKVFKKSGTSCGWCQVPPLSVIFKELFMGRGESPNIVHFPETEEASCLLKAGECRVSRAIGRAFAKERWLNGKLMLGHDSFGGSSPKEEREVGFQNVYTGFAWSRCCSL